MRFPCVFYFYIPTFPLSFVISQRLDSADPLDANAEARIRVKNAPILLDPYAYDVGLSPTNWQRQQFPAEFHHKITVRHDEVDTAFFQPQAGAKLELPAIDLDLIAVDEVVTYTTRGMEPYRVFSQLMEAVDSITSKAYITA